MRFMVMHKVTPEMETGARPDPEVIQGVGKMIGEGTQQKIFLGGEGLKPTSQRVHLKYAGGQRTLTNGPFADARELPGGFALLKVSTKEEALAWCDRFADAMGDVELFMGPVVEGWDLGFGPKPANAPLRFLALHRYEDRPPDAKTARKMSALVEEMTKAGVLQSTAGLLSPKHGARLHFEGGRRKSIVDGPFAESKELVAGYCLLELPSLSAAIEWADRFGAVVKVHEIDVRQVAEVTP